MSGAETSGEVESGEVESGEAESDDQRELQRGARRSRLRAIAWVIVGLVLIATPLVVRVAVEGNDELARAEQARRAEDVDAEIEHLGRAARWRMPGLSHDEAALDLLKALGQRADDAGEEQRHVALAAYREIRRALLATRAFSVPHPERFDHANVRIASLMAAQERAFGTQPTDEQAGDDGRDAEAFHLALLRQVPGPDPWRGNLAALAFVAWLFTTAGFVLRGLDGSGRLRPRPALRWGGTALAMLIAWATLLGADR